MRHAWTTRSATVGIPNRRYLPGDFGISRCRTGDGTNGADGSNGADPLIARVGDGTAPPVGSRVSLVADPEKLHLFDAATGRRLN